jgi:hypothetical protein
MCSKAKHCVCWESNPEREINVLTSHRMPMLLTLQLRVKSRVAAHQFAVRNGRAIRDGHAGHDGNNKTNPRVSRRQKSGDLPTGLRRGRNGTWPLSEPVITCAQRHARQWQVIKVNFRVQGDLYLETRVWLSQVGRRTEPS